jgi:hypothetical protein
MDKLELRKKDFITSLILIAFGIFMITYTLTSIPMKDSWGGVMNVWFVSPGLFPVVIGALLMIMGLILCNRAIKDGGARRFFQSFFHHEKERTGKTSRFLGILLILVSYVYLYIPRVDYFLSTLLALMAFISFFYLDRPDCYLKLFTSYLIGCLLFLTIFILKIDQQLNQIFLYFVDLLVFLFFLIYLGYSRFLTRRDGGLRRRWRISLLTSVITSLVLIPSFKFLLLVPLPVEGGMIELMNVVRYALR